MTRWRPLWVRLMGMIPATMLQKIFWGIVGQTNTTEGTGKQMERYELKGDPTDAALPPLQAASEEAALGTFARELNLKLDFAEEGETGEYVLTNTSTWKEWWVVISG